MNTPWQQHLPRNYDLPLGSSNGNALERGSLRTKCAHLNKLLAVAFRFVTSIPASKYKVHVEHLTVNYRSDGTATKHAFKVTVQDKQYHFSVKKDAGNGHDISTQIAAMDCVRRSVSQCVRSESFTLRDGPHFAMLQAY
jgi:hypothetical protein